MMFLRVVPPGQPRISRAGPSRGPPGQRPREGASERVGVRRSAAFPLWKQRGNWAFAKVPILLILLWFRKKQQTENIPGKLTAEREFAAGGGTVRWKIVQKSALDWGPRRRTWGERLKRLFGIPEALGRGDGDGSAASGAARPSPCHPDPLPLARPRPRRGSSSAFLGS